VSSDVEGITLANEHHRAIKDERKVAAKLEAVQDKIKRLLREGRTLSLNATGTRDFTKLTVEEYAKVACQQFCDAVSHTLPREIRDMIYGFINTQEKVTIQHHRTD
jgi:hypothetical protein